MNLVCIFVAGGTVRQSKSKPHMYADDSYIMFNDINYTNKLAHVLIN